MNSLFFNSKSMKLEMLPYKFIAKHADGRELTVYSSEEDVEQVIKRYMSNNFTITSSGPIELTESQQVRFNEVRELVESHPRPNYLSNFDILEHYIYTGYVNPNSELIDLVKESSKHHNDALDYYTNLLKTTVKSIRENLKYQPLEYKGYKIKLDQDAVNNIYFLYSGLSVSGLRDNLTQFKLLDKSYVQFNAEDIQEVYKLTYKRVQDVFKLEELANRWIKELTLNQIVNYLDNEEMLHTEMNNMLQQVKG